MALPVAPVPTPPPDGRGGTGRERLLTPAFVAVFAANLLQGMSFFLYVHLPRFLVDLGATDVAVGAIVALTAVVAVLARPAIGSALDRRGRRVVLVVGAVLNVLATLAYVTVTALGPWLVAIRILHGLAEATMFTAIFTVGADLVPASRRTEGLALFGVSGLLPIALGGLLGDVLLARGDIDDVFLTSAAFAAGALLLALGLPVGGATTRGPGGGPGRGGFRRTLLALDLRPVWWLTFAFSFSLAAYFVFIAVFVDTVGVGTVGAFFGAYVATAVGLRLAFAWVPQRVGERRVLLPACLALGLGLLVLAAAGSTVGVAIAGVLCGAGHGYVFPILFATVVTRAGEADRGSAMALFSALFDLGTLFGGPLLGLVVTLADYATMFRFAAVLMVVATVVYARWDRRVLGSTDVGAGVSAL